MLTCNAHRHFIGLGTLLVIPDRAFHGLGSAKSSTHISCYVKSFGGKYLIICAPIAMACCFVLTFTLAAVTE